MTEAPSFRLAGVMGWPVGHSLSPALHGHWLARYGIRGAYVPLAVPPDRAEQAIRALPSLGFRGVNVTIPHKETAVRSVDRLDAAARRIGAVNTIIVGEDGALEGRNTDAFGFLENLRQASPGWTAAGGPAVVLGAGGAARAVVAALVDGGATDIRVVNRTVERALELGDVFGDRVAGLAWKDASAALDGAGLLVNTTSLGMAGEPALDLDLRGLPTEALVTDIVYAPLLTPLLDVARKRGNPTVDGLGMLLHQARPGFEAWFGVTPTVDAALREAVLAAPAGR